MIRGIRGATTVNENNEEEILDVSKELLGELIEKNDISPEDVASVFISMTPDLSGGFPARALRMFQNWTYVPVMCMQEVSVPNSLPNCIRFMLHVNTSEKQANIEHVYLRNAITLRPDLQKET